MKSLVGWYSSDRRTLLLGVDRVVAGTVRSHGTTAVDSFRSYRAKSGRILTRCHGTGARYDRWSTGPVVPRLVKLSVFFGRRGRFLEARYDRSGRTDARLRTPKSFATETMVAYGVRVLRKCTVRPRVDVPGRTVPSYIARLRLPARISPVNSILA